MTSSSLAWRAVALRLSLIALGFAQYGISDGSCTIAARLSASWPGIDHQCRGRTRARGTSSEYLRLIKTGETILVTERNEVVAEMRPARRRARPADEIDVLLDSFADTGDVARSVLRKRAWSWWSRGLGLPAGTVQALLDEIRADCLWASPCVVFDTRTTLVCLIDGIRVRVPTLLIQCGSTEHLREHPLPERALLELPRGPAGVPIAGAGSVCAPVPWKIYSSQFQFFGSLAHGSHARTIGRRTSAPQPLSEPAHR